MSREKLVVGSIWTCPAEGCLGPTDLLVVKIDDQYAYYIFPDMSRKSQLPYVWKERISDWLKVFKYNEEETDIETVRNIIE